MEWARSINEKDEIDKTIEDWYGEQNNGKKDVSIQRTIKKEEKHMNPEEDMNTQ